MLTPILMTFILYAILISIISYIAYYKTNSLSDYMLAGRNLNGPLAAMGVGAADMSAWLMMSVPGAVMVAGLSKSWIVIGLTIGAFINWMFVAKKLRVYTEVANDSLTIPTFFHNRFHSTTGTIRITTSIVLFIFFIIYAASGFTGCAQLIESTFSIQYHYSLIISSFVIIAYTMVGGFLALNWLDLFQGTLMLGALIIVPVITTLELNGISSTFEILQSTQKNFFSLFDDVGFMEIISLLTWGLGYFGQPHILVRFMAARTPRDLTLAKKICMTWMILALSSAVCTGLVGAAYFKEGLDKPETVFILLSKLLFNPWMSGVLLAAFLSAIMSTVSALLIACSSCITEDIYHLISKENSNKKLIFVGRVSVVLTALIAMYIAKDPNTTVFSLVEYAWSGLGASFGPAILCSLFWRRTTENGAKAGMIVGALTVILWESFSSINPIYAIGPLLPGFFLSLSSIVIFSRLDKMPSRHILEEFDNTNSILQRY